MIRLYRGRPQGKRAKLTGSATQTTTQSDDLVIRLLATLKEGALSSGGLRQNIGLTHRATFWENYLVDAEKVINI